MMNKSFFGLSIVLLAFACFEMFYADGGSVVGFGIAEFMALAVMLISGTFMQTRYFKFAVAIVFCVLFGVVFKILHLVGGDLVLSLSLLLLPVPYLVYFIVKKNRKRVDVLKLITVLVYSLTSQFVLMHFSIEDNYWVGSMVHYFFWFTFFVFVVDSRKNIRGAA